MPALQQTYASLTQLTFVGASLDALTNDIKNLKASISKQDQGVLSLTKTSIIMKIFLIIILTQLELLRKILT